MNAASIFVQEDAGAIILVAHAQNGAARLRVPFDELGRR
jgi:hypothetical protein